MAFTPESIGLLRSIILRVASSWPQNGLIFHVCTMQCEWLFATERSELADLVVSRARIFSPISTALHTVMFLNTHKSNFAMRVDFHAHIIALACNNACIH